MFDHCSMEKKSLRLLSIKNNRERELICSVQAALSIACLAKSSIEVKGGIGCLPCSSCVVELELGRRSLLIRT